MGATPGQGDPAGVGEVGQTSPPRSPLWTFEMPHVHQRLGTGLCREKQLDTAAGRDLPGPKFLQAGRAAA